MQKLKILLEISQVNLFVKHTFVDILLCAFMYIEIHAIQYEIVHNLESVSVIYMIINNNVDIFVSI